MQKQDLWVIISGGEFPGERECEYLLAAAQVVCADSGANHAFDLGIIPLAVIGDEDSILPEAKQCFVQAGVRFIKYPGNKDYTDTQLAIEYALSQGAEELVLIAASGGRMDHFLANVFLLVKFNSCCKIKLLSGQSTAFLCDAKLTSSLIIEGQPGDLLSLLPLSQEVCGVTLSGLEYPLYSRDLQIGDNIGISNVFSEAQAHILFKTGILLLIHTIS